MTVANPNSQSDATDRMGQLLLSGWIMMQDACAVCYYPLFANPKDRSHVKCVNCTNNPSVPQPSSPAQPTGQAESLKVCENQPPIQIKIDALVKELVNSPADVHNIEYQLNLSKLILNCLHIKSYDNKSN